jgi:hypothetical protein
MTDISRVIESIKRESNQNLDTERAKVNGLIRETKETIAFQTNDKVGHLKEELLVRIRDLEKVFKFHTYLINISSV